MNDFIYPRSIWCRQTRLRLAGEFMVWSFPVDCSSMGGIESMGLELGERNGGRT